MFRLCGSGRIFFCLYVSCRRALWCMKSACGHSNNSWSSVNADWDFYLYSQPTKTLRLSQQCSYRVLDAIWGFLTSKELFRPKKHPHLNKLKENIGRIKQYLGDAGKGLDLSTPCSPSFPHTHTPSQQPFPISLPAFTDLKSPPLLQSSQPEEHLEPLCS